MSLESLSQDGSDVERPEPTPDNFNVVAEAVGDNLRPLFEAKAQAIVGSEAGIQLAFTELIQRIRIMGSGLTASARPEQIDALFDTCVESQQAVADTVSSDYLLRNIDSLRYCIVHTGDDLRQAMVDQKVISKQAIKKLKELDANSAYYKPPRREFIK